MITCSGEEYFYKVDNMVLSSTQHVFHVFKARWKVESGEEWVDGQIYILKFLDDLGVNAFKKALPSQKNALKTSSSIQDWDMTLLSLIIQNFGDEVKYKKENTACRQLKNMRNECAHHPTKKFTQDCYNENVKILKDCLHSLNMKERDIDNLIQKAGVTSSLKALEKVEELYKNAVKIMKSEKMDQAIQIFTEAISTPSLLPVNLGEAYEKRADCYLKSGKNLLTDGEYIDQALLDVKQALELNSGSWNAHHLAAQCHRRKNNLYDAIRHYEMAVAIAPSQMQLKQDLDSCKLLAGIQCREDHMNPNLMPMNLEERVAHLENETGVKISGKEFLQTRHMAMIVKGQEHVDRGHQYINGWGVLQDFMEAARCYAKADSAGNPEGSYNLGECYSYGRGVKQDLVKAMQIYKRVSEMDRNTVGAFTYLQYNLGVACSQHALGLMYENGYGVEKDLREAAGWYKKAMENGLGHAANNLGLLYFNGLRVPVDEKMAEMCWKQAINLKDSNAAGSLVVYYKEQLEPEKATGMLDVGRKMGNANLISKSDEKFQKMMEDIKSSRLKFESDIMDFEKTHNLPSKGMTFKKRITRMWRQMDPNFEKYTQIFERTISGRAVSSYESWGGKMTQSISGENLVIIEKRAQNGSEIASRTFQTVLYFLELIKLLEETSYGGSDAQKRKILELLYNMSVLEPQVVTFPHKLEQKLKVIIAQLFEENCDQKGEDDMKIRFCHVNLNLRGSFFSATDTFALEILKEGLRRYPKNAIYYDNLSCCFGYKKMYKEGKVCAEGGLKYFPENVNLMYYLAVHQDRLRHVDGSEMIEAYKKFLSAAPVDHRKVPEAHYNISKIYSRAFREEDGDDAKKALELVKSWLQAGQEAEKQQLPIYLPYGESDVKASMQILIAKQLPQPVSNTPTENLKFVSILERKEYLKSPTRKALLLQHCHNLKTFKKLTAKKGHKSFSRTPKLKQTVVKEMAAVRPITLLEMNPRDDHIYVNRSLDLTIIDDPNPYPVSINLIAEDDNGDVTRLYIYNVRKDKISLARFQPGCRIAIINPYMRIGAQSISNGIRNDEPRCIIHLEKVENMCTFCGEQNAQRKCSHCKRAYCSRECQVLDWKEMDHKTG